MSIGRTTASLDRAVYAANPRAIADAVAGTSGASLGERRRLKKEAQRLYLGRVKLGREDLAGLLSEAARQLADWTSARSAADGSGHEAGLLPAVPESLVELTELHAECRSGRPRRMRSCRSSRPPTSGPRRRLRRS